MNSEKGLKLNFVNMLRNFISVFCVYVIGSVFPIAGFLVPVFKIRGNQKLNKREVLVVNIVLLIVIGSISLVGLGAYISIYLLIEIAYYAFRALKKKFPVFDRMIITAIISTIFIIIGTSFMGEELTSLKKMIEEIYVNNYEFSENEVKFLFNYLTEYKYLLVYIYTGLITYMTYSILDRGNYLRWKMSYGWIGIYIIGFFMVKSINYQPILFDNIIGIIKISYIFYGIKTLARLINIKVEKIYLSQVLGVIVAFLIPTLVFIIGVVDSFEMVKLKIIKK